MDTMRWVGVAMSLFQDIYMIIEAIDVLFAISIIFLERHRPASSIIAWLLLLFLLPIVGFIMYLFFGQTFYSAKVFDLKGERDRHLMDSVLRRQRKRADELSSAIGDYQAKVDIGTMGMLLKNNSSLVSTDNELQVFFDGKEKFEAFFRDIEAAKEHIHIEYYLIRNDDLGKKLAERLTAKALEGVKVRLVYDAVGGHDIPSRFFKDLIAAGGEVHTFHTLANTLLNPKKNNRNHRKIAVMDGTVGYIGGYNIGNEYLGIDEDVGYWRDAAVRVRGTGVHSLQMRFILDWNYAGKDSLGIDDALFPEGSLTKGSVVQVVSSGPDTEWSSIKEAYLRLISTAKDKVFIQSPYFVPDQSILEALRVAALSGVDVRVMIPNRPDHIFVYWSSFMNIGDLLDAGVRGYRYEGGFIHAKTITVDDRVCSLGSANFDIRSFTLNFESNIVMYDPAVARSMGDAFMDDVERCNEITLEEYQGRSNRVKSKEMISKLFNGLL